MELDTQKANEFKSRPTGDFAEIEQFFDESQGDLKIDITDLKEWNEPDIEVKSESYHDSRKSIQVNMLFGSKKPFGSLLTKRDFKKKPYSARRVFGYTSPGKQ